MPNNNSIYCQDALFVVVIDKQYKYVCCHCKCLTTYIESIGFNRMFHCVKCFNKLFKKCDGCFNHYTHSELKPILNGYRCSSCYDNYKRKFNNSIVLANKSFDHTNGIKLHYGVEIECIAPEIDYDCCAIGWSVKEDGSISSELGQEYYSKVLLGNAGIASIAKQLNMLNRDKFEVDNSCGLHIHVDATELTQQELVNIMSFIWNYDSIIYSLVAPSRSNNKYCNSFRDSISYQNIFKHNDKEVFKRYFHDACRYKGFNLVSYYTHGSIEFRYHHGTTNFNKVYNWLVLCLSIVEYGKRRFWEIDNSLNRENENSLRKMLRLLRLTGEQKDYWRQRFNHFKAVRQERQVANAE